MGYKIAIMLSLAISAQSQIMGRLIPATTYFVDQGIGSDSNNGTSPSTPFLTLAKCQSVLTSGQSCAVNSGPNPSSPYIYRETLTLPNNTAAVGYGATKPVVACDDVIGTGTWSKTGGFTNIYQSTVTTDNGGGTGFLSFYKNSTQLLQSASQAALDSATNSYFVTSNGSLSGTTQTLFVNVGGNPAVDGNTYEYSHRSNAVTSLISSSVIASNFLTRRNFGNNGSFEIGVASFASDIEADNGTKHNALIHGKSYWQNITLKDSYYAGQAKILLVLNDDSPVTWDATFVNITCSEAVESGSECLFGHRNTSGGYGTVTVNNINTSGLVTTGIGGFSSNVMVINGGTVNSSITLPSPVNTLSNVTLTGGQIGITGFPSVNTLSGLVSSGSFSNGNIRLAAATGITLSITGCDFSNSTAFDGNIYFPTGYTPGSSVITGNIFRSPVQTNYIEGPGTSTLTTGTVTYDNNTYHYINGSTASWQNFAGSNYDFSNGTRWAAWQALGFDVHGTRVTP